MKFNVTNADGQRARGSLGKGNREAVLAELAKSRQEWER